MTPDGSRNPEPLTSYSFHYENCVSSCFVSYQPDRGTNLLGNLYSANQRSNQFTCGISNGVREDVALTSTSNITALRQKLVNANPTANDEHFSIEMWIRPSWNLSSMLTIWAIASVKSNSQDNCDSSMKLVQVPTSNITQTYFALVACSSAANSALALSSPLITMERRVDLVEIIHLVVTVATTSYAINTGPRSSIKISEISTNFTVNGIMELDSGKYFVYSGSTSMSFRSWKDSDRLIVFPNAAATKRPTFLDPYKSEANLAILHSLRIYSTIILNIERSPPIVPSPLVGYNSTEIVKENGEVGDHYFDPSYYDKPVPIRELHTFCIGLFDLDMHPSSPNYIQPLNASFIPTVFLSSKDSTTFKGQIFYLNGSALPFVSNEAFPPTRIPWESALNCHALRYRPPWNEYSNPPQSVYDQLHFQYKVQTITSDYYTINFIVQEVAKPPVSTSSFAQTISRTRTYLTFAGTAYKQRTIEQVFITELPHNGDLMVRMGEINQLIDGSMLGNAFPVHGLSYIYQGSEGLLSANNDAVGNDRFFFGVIDNMGLRSTVKEFLLNISTCIESYSTQIWGEQNRYKALKIRGQDFSDLHLPLYSLIADFPRFGVLSTESSLLSPFNASIDPQPITTSNPIVPYPLLPVYYHEGIPLLYKPTDPYFFTIPERDWTGQHLNNPDFDTFTTLLVRSANYTAKEASLPISRMQQHRIIIKNVNDPTTIYYPQASASSTSEYNERTIAATIYAFGSNTQYDYTLSQFVLTNVSLYDPDRGVDLIRVVVQTLQGGSIQLNHTAVKIGFDSSVRSLFFAQTPYCQTPATFGTDNNNSNVWSCTGDLFQSKSRFSFVSTVSTAQSLLNGAIYRSTKANIQESIRITVYDGVGGQCLSQSMHNNNDSLRSECFEAFLEFKINVGDLLAVSADVTNAKKKQSELMSKLQYAAIGLMVLIALLIVKWCWNRRSRKQNNRKNGGNKEILPSHEKVKSNSEKKRPQEVSQTDRRCSTPPRKLNTTELAYQTPPRKEKRMSATIPNTPSTAVSTPDSTHSVSPRKHTPTRSKPKRHNTDNCNTNALYQRLPTHSPEPATSPRSRLPNDWSAHRHHSGKVFYYNSRTKKSSWKFPNETFEVKL